MPQNHNEARPTAMRETLLKSLNQYVMLRLNAFRTLTGRLDAVDELGNCIVTIREGDELRPCVVRGQAIIDVVATVRPQVVAEEDTSAPQQDSDKPVATEADPK